MLKSVTTLLSLTALTLGLIPQALTAESRERHRHNGKFYMNIAAEDVVPLLAGKTFVAHVDWNGLGTDASGGHLEVIHFAKTGEHFHCWGYPSRGEAYSINYRPKFEGEMVTNQRINTTYPRVKFSREDGSLGWRFYRYDSKTGALTDYYYKRPYWWEMHTGHLQERIPAAVYDLCPDFPSAKSLGVGINSKQTAQFYYELLAQDPGRRVLKPEYETAVPVTYLDRFGNPRAGAGFEGDK